MLPMVMSSIKKADDFSSENESLAHPLVLAACSLHLKASKMGLSLKCRGALKSGALPSTDLANLLVQHLNKQVNIQVLQACWCSHLNMQVNIQAPLVPSGVKVEQSFGSKSKFKTSARKVILR